MKKSRKHLYSFLLLLFSLCQLISYNFINQQKINTEEKKALKVYNSINDTLGKNILKTVY